MKCRAWSAFALLIALSGLTYASGPTKLLSSLPGLRIWDYQLAGAVRGSAPGTVRRSFTVEFKNETLQEISEIQVRDRVDVEGKTIYRSKPVAITSFENVSYPHSGSLLPENRSYPSAIVSYEYPNEYWNTASSDHLEIVSVRIYTPNQDLHDPGHLLTWLGGHSSKDAIAMFKAHPELMHVRNARNLTAFIMEFAVGDIPTIKYMAAHGCSWSDQSVGGTTILHMASLHDPTHCQLALDHVRNVDVKTKNGRTPLMVAITFGNPRTVTWLLSHKANANALDANKYPVAFYAIQDGQKEFLEQLVKSGANPKYHDPRGYGWIHYAAATNSYMFDSVVRHGVSVDDRVGNGATALMYCAADGQRDGSLWLLKHGANPRLEDSHGRDCFALAKLSNTLHTDRFFRDIMAKAGRS